MKAELGDIVNGYELFSNEDEIAVDFLINGPSCLNEADSQAKANKLISIAGDRKDCMAVISPHRGGVVDVQMQQHKPSNIIRFFSALTFFLICCI